MRGLCDLWYQLKVNLSTVKLSRTRDFHLLVIALVKNICYSTRASTVIDGRQVLGHGRDIMDTSLIKQFRGKRVLSLALEYQRISINVHVTT